MTLNNPLAHPLHFAGLELTVIGLALVTLVHALSAWRRGQAYPLFVWLSVLSYGVWMELISYNYLDNFHHGPFSVMLYHGKLPLYVVAFYPLLIYTSIMAVGRLGLGRLSEPFAVGLAIVLLDMPFDILGPDSGWWDWQSNDPNLRERWLTVPLTSYYWHITFGGCLSLLTRSVRSRLTVRAAWLALTPIAGALTIVCGALSFIPFHLLKTYGGISDAANLAILIVVAVGIVALAKKGAVGAPDRVLLTIPFVYHAFFLLVLLTRTAPVAAAQQKALMIVLATGLSLSYHLFLQWSRPRPVEAHA